MNTKSLKVVLIYLVIALLQKPALAEEMPESSKFKADRLEVEINELFQRGFRMASKELDVNKQVRPFAVIQRKDGKYGVFSTESNEKSKNLSIDAQTASIRKYLIELVIADQINASMQVMYATVKQKDGSARQGLMFEIEHVEGISLIRFLPVSKIKNKQGEDTGNLLFEMESLSTSVKPKVIFAFAKVK